MVLLVFKESYLTLDDTNSPLPSVVTSLLLEFEDVFIEEMPIGLPPITVHSKTLDEHIEHLQCVLDVLRKEKLYANYKKCTFCMEKVVFLGFVVSANGIEMDQEKVRAIRAWPTPKSITKVRSFHGLASFYQQFVKDFSTIAAPLLDVVKNNVAFTLSIDHDKTFIDLKERLCFAPVLALPAFNLTFEIECDALE
ncbi:uncharacterized mitochondrial protein AtMg00860-like [Citrus sinensis]|uniref:uncharacterized protein LOC112099531 n=1 Tax=Citrus clementina TaxID=85681 RepID=UPI000CED180C|nr:uncharacterized protein LOC112099531 [Citrus x clementina]XP_052289981.1 uncharacterized mitochondrial protein AtMg00860-like [Citrus sinensis]